MPTYKNNAGRLVTFSKVDEKGTSHRVHLKHGDITTWDDEAQIARLNKQLAEDGYGRLEKVPGKPKKAKPKKAPKPKAKEEPEK